MGFFDFFKINRKKEINLICFDLDNTLEDYGAAESETEAHVAEFINKKIKIISKKKKTSIRAIDILNIFNEVKHLHLHHALKPEEFSRALWLKKTIEKLNIDEKIKNKFLNQKELEKLEKYYWDYMTPRLKLFPNSAKLLDELKKTGKYKLALLTDSDGKKEFKIHRINFLDLEKYFDYIITTDITGINKPAIENFEYLLKISSVEGKNCMMVGDHPEVDLINAKKMNFSTVWTKEHIKTDQHLNYVDYEINDIIEVLDVLKKL